MTTPTSRIDSPRVLPPGDGEHIWFLGNLVTVKVAGPETAGNLTVIEFLAPAGFGPPLHRHDVEDELFYVLDGEVTFSCAGNEATYGPGGLAWLPKGLPHRFEVSEHGPARILQITTPAQFEDFARAVGVPAARPELPEPSEPDVDALVRIAADFQIEILPPA